MTVQERILLYVFPSHL